MQPMQPRITSPAMSVPGALDALLALGDCELWNLLSGREEPADRAVAPLVEQLRAI